MARIAFRYEQDVPAVPAIELISPAKHASHSDSELRTLVRRFLPSQNESLELTELEFEPHAVVAPHAHGAAEIIYVTHGELIFGNRHCGPGTAIYIDAETRYGFRIGADGARFLNFRGQPRPTFLYQDELVGERKTAGAT